MKNKILSLSLVLARLCAVSAVTPVSADSPAVRLDPGSCEAPAASGSDPAVEYTWSLIGDICGTGWEVDIPMLETAAGTFAAEGVRLHKDEQFKIRKDQSWEINYGVGGVEGGDNFTVPQDGVYDVVLTDSAGNISITLRRIGALPQDSVVWSLCGNILGTTWDEDIPLLHLSDRLFYTRYLILHQGEEFKVRKDQSWEINYGAGGVLNGDNIAVPTDGLYNVRFWLLEDCVVIELELIRPLEDPDPAVPSVWGMIGNVCGTNWDTDIWLMDQDDGTFAVRDLILHAGEDFKIRKNRDWSINFGADGVLDGDNITVPQTGVYDVIFRFDGQTAGIELNLLREIDGAEPVVWSVIGDICGTLWDTDFPLYEGRDGVFTSEALLLSQNEECKIRKDQSWDVNYGAGGVFWGDNLIVPVTAVYHVVFSISDSSVSVELQQLTDEIEPEEPVNYEGVTFAVIGSIQGTNWHKDFPMEKQADGNWSLVMELKAYDEFKVRSLGDWTYNFGVDASGTNAVVLEDGWYLIYLDLAAGIITVEKTDPPAPPQFTDVPEGAFYADAVAWAVANGITNGTSSTTFSPGKTCTRAQVVAFLWRAKGSPEPRSTENPFTDVKADAYYYKAVLWAVENNITNGTSETTFGPGKGCTRAQVVTFLWRAEGEPEPQSSDNPFTDVTGGYYLKAVLWAVEQKITNGKTATTFAPGATCTRGQIVTFLYRDLA